VPDDHSKSKQAAAAARLARYLSFDFSRDGGGGPIDPRCKVCRGNAGDVDHQGRVDFQHLHSTRATYLAPQVWRSHFFPLEGYQLGDRRDNEITLPEWVTTDTPYFVYAKSEPLERFSLNPLVLRVFIRPCSLCGDPDPFGYIERHLSVDFAEQGPPLDLEAICTSEPPEVPIARAARPSTDDGHADALRELNRLREHAVSRPPFSDSEAEDPSSTRPANITCDEAGCPAQASHRFCPQCGREL